VTGVLQLLVNIDVDDLDRGVAFYTSAFDLRVARRFGDAGVELLGAGVAIHLLLKPAGTPAAASTAAPRDYRRHWTPVHLDIVVDDIDVGIARALAAGAVQERPVSDSEWGRLALMADPFGHGFCLLQFVGRGYDAIAS
jgi:predicted enzyme related to lactoylglutathione lyase